MLILELDYFTAPENWCHLACETKRGGTCIPTHGHRFYEVFWVQDGRGWHILNGTRHPLEQGCLWFLTPSDAHRLEVPEGRTLKMTNLALRSTLVEDFGRRYPELRGQFFWPEDKSRPATYQDTAVIDAIQEPAEQLWNQECHRFATESFLHFFLGRMMQIIKPRHQPDLPSWLATGIRELSSPDGLADGLEGFYRRCGRSPEHISRVVRDLLHTTPWNLVNKARLDRAATLLRSTALTVSEIYQQCGYERPNTFYESFKKQFGMNPGAFREHHRQIFRLAAATE